MISIAPAPQSQPDTPLDSGVPGLEDLQEQELGARLQSLFIEYKDARDFQEREWLDCLRQFMGQYDATTLANIKKGGGRSEIFVGLTRTKVMAGYARIVDLLFQPGENCWAVEPTPVPELAPEEEQAIKARAAAELVAIAGQSTAEMPDLLAERAEELAEEIREKVREKATEAAEEMTREIADKIVEADGEQKLKEAFLEACLFGTGAIKVGTVRIERQRRWLRQKAPSGDRFAQKIVEVVRPEIESVSIFDLYPDPYATDNGNLHGLFRRHVLTRRQFSDLRLSPGFSEDAINEILKLSPRGNYTEFQHERDRRNIAGQNVSIGQPNRYEVLEYWGSINGYDLQNAGVKFKTDAELDVDYDASVWISGGKVIRAVLSPLSDGTIPYKIFPYDKMPHQFWGVGIAHMMRDSQSMMNAATRIYIDSMAISSGPILEINTDFLAAGEDPTDLYPWRVFLREGGDPQSPMVRFNQPQANAAGLVNIIEMFRRFADETTSLPSYTHGETAQSMNKTATGMSILMGNANVALKTVIKNIDAFCLQPMVVSLYNFEMEWGENMSAKGDMRVAAQGSTSLMQREVKSQRMLQFLQLISNPLDAQYTKRRELLVEIAKSMDINPDKVIASQGEIERAMAQNVPGNGGGDPNAQGPVPQGMGPAPQLDNGAAGGLPGQVGERAGSQI